LKRLRSTAAVASGWLTFKLTLNPARVTYPLALLVQRLLRRSATPQQLQKASNTCWLHAISPGDAARST
jgi:hypothetical protein